MANHKSALKRHRQSEKRRIRNTAVKSSIKTSIKNLRSAISKGDSKVAGELLTTTAKELDKAASKGSLHRNNASRKISRLTTAVNSIGAK